MKKLFTILFFALIFSQCSNNHAQEAESIIQNVDAKKFKEMSDTANGIILDVRTPEEVAEGYIEGASAINFYDDDFAEKINLIQKDKPIFVYCKSGGRSSQAADLLKKSGFKEVYNLNGGIMSWENNGFPMVKPVGDKDEKIQQLSLADFSKMLQTDKPVLVDFHTKWCVPCKKMAPVVDKIAEQYKDKAIVLRIDVDKSKEVARHYQIQGIPVFILFRNGEEKWRHNGIIPEAELNKKIEENL